jgi:hypothetical protein
MALESAGSALVAGSQLATARRWIRVLRPFFYGGKLQAIGTPLEVDRFFADEMRSSNKAEGATAPAEPAPTPAVETSEDEAADKPRRRKKGESDAS